MERALGARVRAPGLVPVLVPIGKVLGKPPHPPASLCNDFASFTQQGRPRHQLRPGLAARKAPGRLVLGTFECHTPLVGCEDGVSRFSLVPQRWAGVLILMVTFASHCCS